MSAVVVEPMPGGTVAQALPRPEGSRANVTEWLAHLCCDGDMRTRAVEYRAVAEQLQVVEATP